LDSLLSLRHCSTGLRVSLKKPMQSCSNLALVRE
jgi:hypothetical protein